MKYFKLKNIAVATLLLGSSSIAFAGGAFSEVSKHLDLEGDFLGFIDFDGDGQEIGEKLNVIYQEFAQVNPNVPPFPLDFPSMFETLGFGSIRSVGMSSMEVDTDLFRNLSVTLLDGEPAGIMGLYGLESIPFRAADIAPADTSTAFSGRLNFNALVSTARALASQVMGPMGEGMVMQGLSQPIPGTDVTGAEVVEALSGGLDLVLAQDFSNPQMPDIKVWVSLEGTASLLPRLEPMLQSMGIDFSDTEAGKLVDLSMFMQDAPIGLYALVPTGTEDLVLYTDQAWVDTFGSGGLRGTPEFQGLADRLPDEAAFYAYSKGFDIRQFEGMLLNIPEVAPMVPAMMNAGDTLLGGLLAPNASATYRRDDALITEGYAGFSYKGMIMAVPAAIGGIAGVGAIIEQQNKARAWEDDSDEDDGHGSGEASD